MFSVQIDLVTLYLYLFSHIIGFIWYDRKQISIDSYLCTYKFWHIHYLSCLMNNYNTDT